MINKEVTESLELLEKIFNLYPGIKNVENDGKEKVSFVMDKLPTPIEEIWFKALMENIPLLNNVKLMYSKEWLPSENVKITFIIKEKKWYVRFKFYKNNRAKI